MTATRRMFVVGAGASAATPANMPLANDVRRAVFDALGLTGAEAATVEQLAPETLLREVVEGGMPVEQWLTETFRAGSPNAVHRVLAEAVRAGEATVWTTNLDECLEAAAPDVAVSAYPDDEPAPDARVLKPHGTVSRGTYIVRTDAVVRPLPAPWAERLRSDIGAADEVVVVGSSARDLDVQLVLADALEAARAVVWFATAAEWTPLQERMPVLRAAHVESITADTGEQLTPAFLRWAESRGLPVAPRSGSDTAAPAVPPLPGAATLARAIVLGRCALDDAARRSYRKAAPNRAHARTALRRLTALDLYQPTRSSRWLMDAASGSLARAVPARVRRKLDRAQVTVAASRDGSRRNALALAERVVDPGDPAVLLARAKAERIVGAVDTAIDCAERARAGALAIGDNGLASEARHELAVAYGDAGRMTASRDGLTPVAAGRDPNTSARWIAWAHHQLACLDIAANDPDRALDRLARARGLFETDVNAAGILACKATALSAYRMEDRAAEFATLAGELEHSEAARAVAYNRGEWARTHGDPRTAALLHALVVDDPQEQPLWFVLGSIAQDELARAERRNGTAHLAAARATATRHGLHLAAAHVTIAEVLAGTRSDRDGIEAIASSGVELTTRTGEPAATVAEFCLGAHPDAHEVFLA
jgi:hypothetical protein